MKGYSTGNGVLPQASLLQLVSACSCVVSVDPQECSCGKGFLPHWSTTAEISSLQIFSHFVY